MLRALRPVFFMVLLPAATAIGCCGPCARWMMSNAADAGPPPIAPGPSGPMNPPGGVPASAADADLPPDVHPKFPWRRSYRKPRTHMTMNGTWVEQLAKPYETFEAMGSTKTDGVKDGLVVCTIRVTGRFDEFRDPDVTARLTVGKQTHLFWGPEDDRDLTFSIPRATWTAGQTIELYAEDRDLTTTET